MDYFTRQIRKNFTAWHVRSLGISFLVCGVLFSKLWPKITMYDWYYYALVAFIFWLIPFLRLIKK